MTRRLTALLGALFLGGVTLAGSPGLAGAQDSAPDIRNIRPLVMLLVDTSGSMERTPGGSTPPPPTPICEGNAGGVNERNRWALVVESLTGSWTDFYCTAQPRSGAAFTGAPDFNYFLDYHQPPIATPQNSDGILDAYIDRAKFGLMTFDSVYTFTDSHPLLVPSSVFTSRLLENAVSPGGYSYGEQRTLTYPGCPTDFMVDSGVRNEASSTGAMISVGPESADHRLVNAQIQTAILNSRPFGGTPTAAMLDDFRFYLNNHPDVAVGSDPFAQCRDRYGLLLTDGQPDEDFRDARFDCDAVGGCPYELAADIAADLCQFDDTNQRCDGVIDGLFVVAFDITDAAALLELDDVANRGGTEQALLATNRTELLSRLAEALDRAAPGTTTRARPAFVTGGGSGSGPATQFEFNAGFRIGAVEDEPWSGVLERTRFVCNGTTLVPEEQPLDNTDRFQDILNARGAPRNLLTVVTSDPADTTGNILGALTTATPLSATPPPGAAVGATIASFSNANGALTAAHLGITTGTLAEQNSRRQTVIDWVHAETGTERQDIRLGDIYHSSPVAVSAPTVDLADESFNLYRQRPEVADRPTVVYVGTNDGILHAFVAEEYTTASGTTYASGEELWGFVPPILLPQLESASAAHQITLDGTAVVKEVFFRRLPGDTPDADAWHTVLIMGFRGGAKGYFALDVTDPLTPQFLWQFVGETGLGVAEMGNSYPEAGVGQILVDIGGALQERAVAVLAGGQGEFDEPAARAAGAAGCTLDGAGAAPIAGNTSSSRDHLNCWQSSGRVLYWVDVATGQILNKLDDAVFNSPLIGSVGLYPGDIGTIAQRAFVTDADGVLWRVDFQSSRTSDWEAEPFFDIFWDGLPLDGQPAFAAPVISVDNEGQLVVIQSTGDIDQLDTTASNRVASVTEVRTISGTNVNYTPRLNWEIVMADGEQATGPIELFEGTVYFASFAAQSSLTDACNVGTSRIWGVDYLEGGGTPPAGYTGAIFPQPRFESVPGSGNFDEHFRGPFDNQLVLGVGVTQRPTCVDGVDEFDPYIGSRFRVTQVGGGTFELRALVSGGTQASGSGSGSQVATITEQLTPPEAYTTISAFAGRADY
ncbi:MAG: pilus assembly protein [Sandaracinaceae bacterium]